MSRHDGRAPDPEKRAERNARRKEAKLRGAQRNYRAAPTAQTDHGMSAAGRRLAREGEQKLDGLKIRDGVAPAEETER